jgi:methionine synthase II (cobalamin-independent)
MPLNDVLMIGSVPGTGPSEVFSRLLAALPGRLQAIPDGETGERINYVGWQLQRFPPVAQRNELGGTPLPELGPPTFSLEDIKPTAYDEVALSSYADFTRLRQQKLIPPGVRFQIGLPSPYNVLKAHLKPEAANAIEPLYEQRMAESIDRIVANFPHDDFVIQWDLCFEIMALEFEQGRLTDKWHQPYFHYSGSVLQSLVDRIVRLCKRMPDDVNMAFHLCYGDLRHKHFIEPEDTSLLVDFANALLSHEAIGPRTRWIHLPVPKERSDGQYFAPLAGLKLNMSGSGSKPPLLYLGLVHANDEAGTRKRIETAQSSIPFAFGIATECGLGRTPDGEIDGILQTCKAVTTERSAKPL